MSVKHDYKSSDKGLRMRRQARFYGLLVITLILIGVFGSLLAFISRTPPGPNTLALPTQQTPAASGAQGPTAGVLPATPPTENPDNSKPKYDFYQLLPERQLDIEEEPEQSAAPQPQSEPQQANDRREPATDTPVANATQTATLQDKPEVSPSPPQAVLKPASTTAASAGNYVVQVGSFRNQNDADRLKASIAFLGISAYIETHNESNGGALHRVRIGPINGAEQVAQLRQRLQQNDIQSIAIKTR